MKIGIVGAGQAACTLIAELVRGQFSGKILVFNGESYRPYQRPPLSKTWLHNPTDTESIRLLPEPIETNASIEWIHDYVVSIEPDQGVIATNNGRRTVDHIVLATGTRAKTLAIDGLPADQVHVIRTLIDTIHLHEALDAHNIAIIGAGFLAFELASASTIQSAQSEYWPKGFARFQKSLSKQQTVFSRKHPPQSALVSQSNGMTKTVLHSSPIMGLSQQTWSLSPLAPNRIPNSQPHAASGHPKGSQQIL